MKFFSEVGPVSDVMIKTHFAFVEYENVKDVYHAVGTLNCASMHG